MIKKKNKDEPMVKNKKGRPSLFEEKKDKIIELIRNGNYYETAARCAGVTYDGFRVWIRKGEEAEANEDFDNQFFHFLMAIKEAEAEAEQKVVDMWIKHCPDNWQACRDFLARRHKEKWAPSEKVEMNHSGETKVNVITNIPQNFRDKYSNIEFDE